MRISAILIPLLLVIGMALVCSSEGTAQDEKLYGIYDENQRLTYYIKGNNVYDTLWGLRYYMRNNVLYDTNWKRQYFIKGSEIYNEDRYLQYRIKEYMRDLSSPE